MPQFAFRTLVLCGLTLALASCAPAQNDGPYSGYRFGTLHPDAPPETEQLGRLAGVWSAASISRNQDGTWRSDSSHADWIWYYILDGHAVQDDWITPPLDAVADTTTRFTGTNIRIYNAAESLWEMAWFDTSVRKMANFKATGTDSAVIMTGRNSRGRDVRITFSNFRENAFDWQQEWTFDGGKTWVVVSKIWCRRKKTT